MGPSALVSDVRPFDEAFRQGLRELGYIEGQNTTIEWRSVEGDFARLPTVAAELLGLKVNINEPAFNREATATTIGSEIRSDLSKAVAYLKAAFKIDSSD